MPRHIPRFFVTEKLCLSKTIFATKQQAHHLNNVVRRQTNDEIFLFNGIDGEWLAKIKAEKQQLAFYLIKQTKKQDNLPDIELWFSPLKKKAQDNLIEKSVELGIKKLQPIICQYSQIQTINNEKIAKQIISAAQQCNIIDLPDIAKIAKLHDMLEKLDKTLLFCDELAKYSNVLDILKQVKKLPVVILIGPEGGFANEERAEIMSHKNCLPISLSKNILRADTAAISAVSLVHAALVK